MFRYLSQFCLLTALLLLIQFPGPAADSAAEIALIKSRLREQLLTTPVLPEKEWPVLKWRDKFLPDGSWADVPYADKAPGGWKPALHLRRVYEMARALNTPGQPLFKNPELAAATHLAWDHWLSKAYVSPNWFYNDIYIPRVMAQIALLMDDQATPEEFQTALKFVGRANPDRSGVGKATGQNRVWLAMIVLMRGVLQEDPKVVSGAVKIIDDEIAITAAEGLQQDFSFHQHGPQLEIGNYGLSFAETISSAVVIPAGTSLAFSSEKVNLLSRYVLEGVGQAVWKGTMDISACGRQLFPGTPAAKGRRVLTIAQAMKEADAPRAPQYQALINASTGQGKGAAALAGNHMYWRSDYMIHRRANYYSSVKMSSTRVEGTEVINKENLSGRLLGRGALYIYQSGNEYTDIFPVWDWRRIPGVTARTASQFSTFPQSEKRNLASFVGGVSDGQNGATVYEGQIIEYPSRAPKEKEASLFYKKSDFFFDDQIVCLGAGINDHKGENLITSINQCWPRQDYTLADGESQRNLSLQDGLQSPTSARWVLHDSLGYLFPEPQKLQVGIREQAGSWQKVYTEGAPEKFSKPVFSLWLDHGAKEADSHYSYILVPGATVDQLKSLSSNPTVQIISNTPELQAVRQPKSAVTFAVFFSPGKLEYAPAHTLAVDSPCLVMIRGTNITVSEPTQKLATLTVTLNGHPRTVTLPSCLNAGSSIKLSGA